MKRSIQSLVIKTGYSPSGTMEGGFGSIRGGTAANDFQTNGGNCSNTGDCGGTSNSGNCTNQIRCVVSFNQAACTNQNGGCAMSTNSGGCTM